MKVTIIVIFLFLSINTLVGQLGMIKDKDGWTNVREKPNANSKVLYVIKEAELFWCDFDFEYEDIEWVEVYIPRDKFSSNGYDGKSVVGFVHKSRIIELDNVEQYNKDNFEFEYFISEFDSIGRNITYQDNRWATEIDGKNIWGTDGSLPITQLDSIKICLDGLAIKIDTNLYNDLFNVRTRFKILRIKNTYIVYHWNSDGAGAYEIGWVIDRNGINQRIVGSRL